MSTNGTHLGIVVGVDGSAVLAVAGWTARDAELRGLQLRITHLVAPVVEVAEGWSASRTDGVGHCGGKPVNRRRRSGHDVHAAVARRHCPANRVNA